MAALAALAASVIAAPASAVELRWGVWAADPKDAEVWIRLVEMVEEMHPDIDIRLETSPWGPYWDKLTTQFATGTAPDIVSLHHLHFVNYADNGLLLDISPLIDASPEIDFGDFYPAAIDGLSLDGRIYGLPYGIAPYLLYYNRDIFDAAGVDYPHPTEPMTFDEFNALMERLHDPEAGVYGFTADPNLMSVLPFLLSNGADYLSADGSDIDTEAGIEAMGMILDPFQEGGAAAPVVDLTSPAGVDQFANGQVALMADGTWMMGILRARGDADWDIAPLPAGRAGSITWSGVSGFAPSATTEHREAAWRVVMALTGPEALELIGRTGREFPARASALESWAGSEIAPDNAELIPALLTGDGDARARPLKGTVHWPRIWNLTQRELGAGFTGSADAETVANRLAAGIERILAE